MNVIALHHIQIAIPPGGEHTARKFYGDLLGLPEVPKPIHLVSRGGIWFESEKLRVHLGVDNEFHAARKAHPAFLVVDLASLATRCSAAGFEVTEDQPLEGFKRVYVFDPFGNRVELLQQMIAV